MSVLKKKRKSFRWCVVSESLVLPDSLLSECPVSGASRVVRNPTERSTYCHAAIEQFLTSRMCAAVVNSDGWEVQTLYKGLVNACHNRAYRGRVGVRKRDGVLVLLRLSTVSNCL